MYLLVLSLGGLDSWPLAPSVPKGNTKSEVLLVKIFSLKQNQIPTATIEK